MANRIKGITIEIGGDTTKLSEVLEGVNKTIKNTQTQLKDVEKLLKLEPTNTELLSQKQRLLADSITATKDKLATLKTAAEQANQALANGEISQEQYDALEREIVETEYVKNLAGQAWSWGSDIIGGIVNGIRSQINDVASAVTSVADTIRSFLHFSVPDEGPLTDFESWMPDFMSGLAKVFRKTTS